MSHEYSEWDAAYVLGALSASERQAFERHLAECQSCSAAVADLAGMPGLLSKVSAADAVGLIDEVQPIPLPATLLPRLVRSARRRQRRVLGFIAGGVTAAAVAAAAIVLVVPSLVAPVPIASPSAATRLVSLSQVVPNPLSASIRLTSEGWGTRIEMDCHYGPPPTVGATPYRPSADGAVGYAMFVTDARGNISQVATWSATPGSTVEPSGTTSLALDEIRRIDVRSASTGAVLLAGRP